MSPKVKCKKEFDKWFGQWALVIEHSRELVEHTPPEKTASADEPEYSAAEAVLHSSPKIEPLRRAH